MDINISLPDDVGQLLKDRAELFDLPPTNYVYMLIKNDLRLSPRKRLETFYGISKFDSTAK